MCKYPYIKYEELYFLYTRAVSMALDSESRVCKVSLDKAKTGTELEFSEIFSKLCSSSKLDRDLGVTVFGKYIRTKLNDVISKDIQSRTMSAMQNKDDSWEIRHGGLLATKTLLCSGTLQTIESVEFLEDIKRCCLHLLGDEESRVRTVAGEILGELCKYENGVEVYLCIKDTLMSLIHDHLDRNNVSDQDLLAPGIAVATSADAFHDTAGWRLLETSMNALKCVIDGCGQKFIGCVDDELMKLIFSALYHRNRFVRETAYFLCSSIFSSCSLALVNAEQISSSTIINNNMKTFAVHLADGLSDNWSQVRMSASVAVRSFLTKMVTNDAQPDIYAILVPGMCLNRYYIAEGVRIYSQETWRQVAGSGGKELVQKYITEIVKYYIKQSLADNHAVREAACTCIAELALKIDREAVQPYVAKLIAALVVCFKDDSWPVRDAACIASGNFVSAFPDDAKINLEVLFPLFFTNLEDNIPSVRQGAAIALGCVAKAYGSEVVNKLIDKINEDLPRVKDQPAVSEKYSQLDKGGAVHGVIKQAMANDAELHSNKPMFSCGSLAPKMRAGGCSNHNFQRPVEPWEKSDGCVYLLAEIAGIQSASGKIVEVLPLLASCSEDKHYPQHVQFLESMFKKLPDIAAGVGKKPFKSRIELFLDAIFYGLSCDNALTATAASQCLSKLGTFLGPNILKGRVEMYNPNYLEQLNATIFSAPF